jgi:glutamate/tyrosine decarboxylase-like PLP-dependent enzyme
MHVIPNDVHAPSLRVGIEALVGHLAASLGRIEDQLDSDRVSSSLQPGSLSAYLARNYDLEHGHAIGPLACDVFDMLYRGIVHPNHRCHFGLFVPGVQAAGVVADTLAALLNPQLGAWWYSPAACEIETFALNGFLEKLGFDAEEAFAHFTSGGSEANATAVVLALTRHFPDYASTGLAVSEKRPVLYASDQAHDSFVKIAHMTGIGRQAVRRVRTDSAFRMDVDDLRQQYEQDKKNGASPFLVVGTAGTTAGGAFDPIPLLVDFTQETGLWLHVDAAWGGLALLLDEFRPLLSGIDKADSVTWDAHKIFPIPMGAGMFFARSQNEAAQAFGVEADYLPASRQGTVDLYGHSIQWSRRFIGLKVFLTLAQLGWGGIASLLRQQTTVAQKLREDLLHAGFSIVNDSALPLVCFTHPKIEAGTHSADSIVDELVSQGRVWLSAVRLSPNRPKALRACITNHRTSEEDVTLLASEVTRILR